MSTGKVLVVEDNDLLRENICEILELEGLEVISAMNGKDGWEKVQKTNLDLVLSDVNMPIMDGFELLKSIREHEQLNGLPFVFLTVRNTMKELRLGMNYGADDYLAKPFEIDQLLTVVQNRLKRNQNTIATLISPQIRKDLSLIKAYELAMQKEVYEPIDQLIDEAQGEWAINRAKTLKSNVYKIISSLKVDKFLKGQKLGKEYLELNEFIELDQFISDMVHSQDSNYSSKFDLKLEPFSLTTPSSYLKIALSEIFENAAKFSDGSYPVIIKGECLSTKAYKITVTNTGLSFSKSQQAEIGAFKTFVPNEGYIAGIGLGLHNAMRILNSIKAKCTISNKPNRQTVFTILLEKA